MIDFIDADRIPDWAKNAEVAEDSTLDYEAYDLFVDGAHVGCVYDDGSGYIFAQGTSTGELFRLDGNL